MGRTFSLVMSGSFFLLSICFFWGGGVYLVTPKERNESKNERGVRDRDVTVSSSGFAKETLRLCSSGSI